MDFGPLGRFIEALAGYQSHSTSDSARERIGARLMQLQKGALYQTGDRFLAFDEDGHMLVVDVQNVVFDAGHQADTLELGIRAWATEEPQSVFSMSAQEADKFCRGERLSLVGSLSDVHDELLGTTMDIPSDVLRLIHEGHPGETLVDAAQRQSVKLPEEFLIDHDLSEAIAHFYHNDPPDYSGLLKALERISAYQRRAVASVQRGGRFARVSPRSKSELGHFVVRPISPTEQAPLYRILIDRYENRVNITERAMLRFLDVMQKETGSVPIVMEWQDTPEA